MAFTHFATLLLGLILREAWDWGYRLLWTFLSLDSWGAPILTAWFGLPQQEQYDAAWRAPQMQYAAPPTATLTTTPLLFICAALIGYAGRAVRGV